MEFILGAMAMLLFFVVYELGKREGIKHKSQPVSVNDERQREIEQFNKGFKALFNYDVDTALQKKKVT